MSAITPKYTTSDAFNIPSILIGLPNGSDIEVSFITYRCISVFEHHGGIFTQVRGDMGLALFISQLLAPEPTTPIAVALKPQVSIAAATAADNEHAIPAYPADVAFCLSCGESIVDGALCGDCVRMSYENRKVENVSLNKLGQDFKIKRLKNTLNGFARFSAACPYCGKRVYLRRMQSEVHDGKRDYTFDFYCCQQTAVWAEDDLFAVFPAALASDDTPTVSAAAGRSNEHVIKLTMKGEYAQFGDAAELARHLARFELKYCGNPDGKGVQPASVINLNPGDLPNATHVMEVPIVRCTSTPAGTAWIGVK